MSTTRQVNRPLLVSVRTGPGGMPTSVAGLTVAHLRESWLIEDRWWTPHPLRRRYWELVSDSGRDIVVFHDLVAGHWYRHR
ncbi:MAG: hypothetical protein NVSMB51_05490 [Solirubrobacteraceae bacterium]